MDSPGRLKRAPENFLGPSEIADVQAGRRGFLRGALLAATAGLGTSGAFPQAEGRAEGDPAILELPEHSKGLGQPVAARPYGSPSQYEKGVKRRESPGLTRVGAAS